MKNATLYIKVEQNSSISNKIVYLEDVAKLDSTDKKMLNDVKRLNIFKIPENKEKKYAFSILKIIEYISDKYPDIEIVNLGETDFLISFHPPKKKKVIFEYLKTLFVAVTIFFGSAFTIMTFNEDASVRDIFGLVYEIFTGSKQESATILELAYSLGIPVGTIVFFNHFSKLKIDNDPTPLQIQMRTYEADANNTVIQNASRAGNENDVD